MMEEVYVRRVDAIVRGVACDIFVITHFFSDGDDVESGKLRVEVTDCQSYWDTAPACPLEAKDLSQTLAAGRMHAALEALTDKSPPSRAYEYAIDDRNILNIRFTAGKVKNRLRVKLQPDPTPAARAQTALTGLGANVRRLRTAVNALTQQEDDLRSLAQWSLDTGVAMEEHEAVAREQTYQAVADMLTEKTRELRLAAGMPEEPEEEVDAHLPAEEEEETEGGDLMPKTASEAEARREQSPDRGEWEEDAQSKMQQA